jgi:hypothetical protein
MTGSFPLARALLARTSGSDKQCRVIPARAGPTLRDLGT